MSITAAAKARAALAQVLEGHQAVEMARVAEALGVRTEALESLALCAYPLSTGLEAEQCLLRDFGRILRSGAKDVGLDAAVTELSAALRDPNPNRLARLLGAS